MPESQLGDVPAFRHGPRKTGFISESVKLTQTTSDSPRTFLPWRRSQKWAAPICCT